MKVSLLTHAIDSETPSYGNKDRIQIDAKDSITTGNTANTSTIYFSNNHIGTHVDVPRHFFEKGMTVTDIRPEEWVFQSVVLIDVPCEQARLISADDFAQAAISPKVDFLIIRTGFELKRNQEIYSTGYPGITPEACVYLRKKYPALRGIGFDFISLTSPLFKEEGKAAHRIFLDDSTGSFVFVVEDMKIAHLTEVPGMLCVSPLLVKNGNGGPVTIFAFN